MHDRRKSLCSDGADDDVHVVGHHAPGKQVIPVAIEMLQVVDDDLCDARIGQITSTCTRAQVVIDPTLENALDFDPGDRGDSLSFERCSFMLQTRDRSKRE